MMSHWYLVAWFRRSSIIRRALRYDLASSYASGRVHEDIVSVVYTRDHSAPVQT